MRRTAASLAAVVSSLLLGQALAHAHLDSSEPAHGASAGGVDAVVLRFSEPVEVAFSTFKLLSIEEALAAIGMPAHDHGDPQGAAEDHEHGDTAEGDEHDHGDAAEGEGHGHAAAALDPLLEANAQAIAAAVLGDPGFNTGLVPAIADPVSGPHAELTLVLAEPLAPGTYVVVFRVLSVDTHAADGYVVFEVTD